MAQATKLTHINDNLDVEEDKLRKLYEAHKDQWPDNALEGGVFQLMKKDFESQIRLTNTKKPHIIRT